MFLLSVTSQWEFETAHGEFVTVHRGFCDWCNYDGSVGLSWLFTGSVRLCLNDSWVELNPGWDLWSVHKRRVGIKREEFNKPFSYHLYTFFRKDPAKYTTDLFNPGWTFYMHFFSFIQPGLSHKRAIAYMCLPSLISTRVETRHVNIAWLCYWSRGWWLPTAAYVSENEIKMRRNGLLTLTSTGENGPLVPQSLHVKETPIRRRHNTSFSSTLWRQLQLNKEHSMSVTSYEQVGRLYLLIYAVT